MNDGKPRNNKERLRESIAESKARANNKRLYGLLGYPVAHSLSAVMHNAAFAALGIDAEYRLFEIKPEDLKEFLTNQILQNSSIKDIEGNSVATKDIYGFNITIPHKLRARHILEEKFPPRYDTKLIHVDLYYVKISGAVNTVKKNGDKLEYYNTDAPGFLQSLENDLRFVTKDQKVFLMGCGGAGRAIIASLSWRQAQVNKIYILEVNNEAVASTKEYFSRLPNYYRRFCEDKLQFISEEEKSEVIKDCSLLINATPVGMKNTDPCLVSEEMLRKDLFVYDVIYNPPETKLLAHAKKAGCGTSNGVGMLLNQGMLAFEIWTGQKAPVEVMRKALREATSK